MSSDDSIFLSDYLSSWPELAISEIDVIKKALSGISIERIEHIGSTSVPGCRSKPIIDIAIQVHKISEGITAIKPLEHLSYKYWDENPDRLHMFFVKGMPPYGSGRTHHVHFFEAERFLQHLEFRDRLRSDAVLLGEYQKLKNELAVKFKHDREAYTRAKGAFIDDILQKNDHAI